MTFPDARKSAHALAVSVLFLAPAPVIESRGPSTTEHIIAEGTYVYGDSSSKTIENWILSKTQQEPTSQKETQLKSSGKTKCSTTASKWTRSCIPR
jgi:hypothetical protein